jgi:hypothetical protein
MTGCIESSFQLATESRLPEWFTVQPELTRTDLSVTLDLYAPLRGPDAKFVLKDRNGKQLAEVKAKTKELSPSLYSVVTETGIAETIKLKPYRRNDNMEENGIPVALFYVIDDGEVGKESSPVPQK